MKRPFLLLVSQVLLLLLGLLFPILFVRFNGHTHFGAVALAATYAAAIISILVTGFSQSILSDGLSLRRLRLYVLSLCVAGAGGWVMQVMWLPTGGWTLYVAVVWVVATQAAVSFVYYYAVRRRTLLVMTCIMPGEALARTAVLFGLHLAHVGGGAWLIGCYVLSNGLLGLACLGFISLSAGRTDPDATGRLKLGAASRFARWSLSGVVVDAFDRAGYGAILPAAERSPFLFFDTLYMTAFGLIANVTRLEILAPAREGPDRSRLMLALIAIGGLASASVATVAVFWLGGYLGRWTGFDPRPIAGAVLYAVAYRGALFVQFVAYAFFERGGRTEENVRPRLIASAALLALVPFFPVIAPMWVAWSSLVIVCVVALLSFRLALKPPAGQSASGVA